MSRRRALAAVFGVLIVVYVISAAVTVYVVRDLLIEAADDDLRTSLDATAAILERFDLDEGSSLGVEANERAILVFDGRDEIAYIAAGPSDAPLPRPDISASSAVARTGEPFTVDAESGDVGYRVLSTELDDGRYLVMAQPLDTLRTVIDALGTFLLITLFAVVAVLGLIFWLMLRASLRPYDDMIDTTEAIAGGDLSRRIDSTTSSPEIERLTTSVNTMLDTIEDSFRARESAEARLQQFVADASHELRTPLTTIRGYSEVYLSGAATYSDDVDRQMTRINAEAARMGRLVDELLTLARLDQQRTVARTTLDLEPVVADAVADARVASPEREYVADLHGPALVDGDVDALRQVVTNLLTNAAVHTPAGTSVAVELTQREHRLTLTVSDDGPGMDRDAADHAFDRFYRADKARTGRHGGSGLGLAIAATVVEAHDGTITVDSTVGVGTTFTVELPVGG